MKAIHLIDIEYISAESFFIDFIKELGKRDKM